nr:photosystem II protein T [Ulva californica]
MEALVYTFLLVGTLFFIKYINTYIFLITESKTNN